MSRRPIIGIPTQAVQSFGGIPAHFPPSWAMSQRYILTLTAAGAIPWLIPLLPDDHNTLRGIYDELDAVFLPGGADIDPSTYGEQRHPKCERSDLARDRVEITLTKWAMRDGKPVFGVCRGLQLINVAAGGTLWQDLETQRPTSMKHDYFPFRDGYARDHLAHTVAIRDGTQLAEIVGAGERPVNSMHHQAVRDLARGLVVSATAPDGLIEAIERPGEQFLLAVQWHPEALAEKDEVTQRLFEAFIAAARAHRPEREAGGVIA
ncbi:MAG: gamma-glutamyl-gamma-aminobutyrate hydrolase family protein [Gemmatimonadota bacterium]|nr:gamma-glutamyl-gamma-aminobutyrate hydrolase family protein [Gemmatimonadota bacterium]